MAINNGRNRPNLTHNGGNLDNLLNWKTTVTALIGAVASLAAHFGFNLGPEVQTVIVTVTMLVLGFFAKDATKTGVTPK